MKQILFIALIAILVVACRKDCCDSPLPDVSIEINYQDSSGKSLIDSNAQYAESNIKVYYKQDGVFKDSYSPLMDNPNKFHVFKSVEGKTVFSVWPSDTYHQGGFSETIIEFNGSIKDTLLCEFDFKNKDYVRTFKNVWFNDVKMDSTAFDVVR